MNREDAQAITAKLLIAGYSVDIFERPDVPEEVTYEVSAQRVIHGESWLCLHLQSREDVQAIEHFFGEGNEP